MAAGEDPHKADASAGRRAGGVLARARRRGVLRVAASYLVIAWLLLQIADVVFEPLGVPRWGMTALIVAAALGLPVALLLAWFYEIGDDGIHRDTAPAEAVRPTVHGVRRYADVIIIGLLLVTVAALLVRQSDLGKPVPPENPSIAVLPFDNLSGDPEQAYFSDGLAEEMLDRLGRVPGLRVLARSSSFSFRGRNADARTVAQRLGATTVLEGSVRRDGRRLRLNARLVDGASGEQIWSGSFDRDLTDVFAVQAELASAVVQAVIPGALGNTALSPAPPTTDFDAYDLLLLARSKLNTRQSGEVQQAVDLAQRAIGLDPDFARAQALLGHALVLQSIYGGFVGTGESQAMLRRAEAAIFRALSLDPDLSDAHVAYATLLRQTNRPGAEQEYQRALELNPNNAAAWHDYGVYLSNVARRPQEAAEAGRRALELDPRSAVTWANYLARLHESGDPRYAAELDRAIGLLSDIEGGLAGLRVSFLPKGTDPPDAEMERRIEQFAAARGALDMASIEAFLAGQPVTAMKLALAVARGAGPSVLPTWITRARAWTMVDLARAQRELANAKLGTTPSGVPEKRLLLWLRLDVAGLTGDYAEVHTLLAELEAELGQHDQSLNACRAFWLVVQDRAGEAAAALELAEPIPDSDLPYRLGGSVEWGQMLPAQLRIYRATGRVSEATALVEQHLGRLRKTLRDPSEVDEKPWSALAGIAANEGLREEAVEALREAMKRAPLPFDFRPELPWFRSLEGYPPYDEILRERARRIAGIRAEMDRLEPAP